MNQRRDWIGLGVFFLMAAVAAVIASRFTALSVHGWYVGIRKPGFTPPNWLFAPTWTCLYILIAIAGWRVWRRRGYGGAKSALAFYIAQLALNAAWSIYFFGLRSPLLGLIVILLLVAAIAATIRGFLLHDRIAAWMMVPYLCWVCYAAALNLAIWLMN